MPRKTLALISGLVLVTVVLFIVAVRTNTQTAKPQPTPAPVAQAPATPAHSVLSLLPNPLTVAPGQQGSADVNIDTSDNAVTAVQLEIAYDKPAPHVVVHESERSQRILGEIIGRGARAVAIVEIFECLIDVA